MSGIKVVEIKSRKELDDFIQLPYAIYRDCPQYVPDLKCDIRNLFDAQKNPAYEFSQIQPFVAYRDGDTPSHPTPVGRIVGIINHKANKRWQTKNVRFSLIEFVDDREVSAALIDAVVRWGRSFGMETIEGPMGTTDFDKEGMLIEDFDLTGTQVRIQVPQEVPARYARTSQYAREQMGLRVVKLTNSDITRKEYGRKIFHLLNVAYQPIFGFSELSERQIDDFVRKYLGLIDKQLIPVVLNDRQEIVGVAITMGCLSRAMQKVRGRLFPTGWWHLLRAMKWRREDSAEMLLVAVHPDYQGMGVNALFFDDLIPIYNKYGFRWAETGPQLEDNVRELSQWKPLKPEFVKRRRCYRKMINDI